MDIDKDLIGKPPNQAIVINDKLTNYDSGTVEAETSQVPEHDTREQLEADIDRKFKEDYKGTHADYCYTRKLIIEWLDRQAAITRRETDEMCDCADCAEGMLANMQQQVDSLTAERDNLRSRLKTQANSFQKLERDNARLRDKLERVRELVDGTG